MAAVLTWLDVAALLVVGGTFTLYALIPFAMANDDPRCGPLLRHGVLQLAGLAGLATSVLLGAWVAHHAVDHRGWIAVGIAAAGWGAWIGGVVLTMALFFGASALDTAVAERRRRRATRHE